MSINKLEISIEQDSNKDKADLHGMNLEVANAFLVLISSLTKIIQNSPNSSSLKINISSGSVVAAIEGEGITQIKNDYLRVVHRQTSDQAVVEPWRRLQKLIKSNGLVYKSQLVVDGQAPIFFHQILRESKTFIAKKRIKPAIQTQIKLLSGKLFQLGGKKNDNLHLEINNDDTIIIECTQEQAEKANQYFKRIALVSTWLVPGVDKDTYILCSSYYQDDLSLFQRFQKFFLEFENANNEIESLERLHGECIDYLEQKKFRDLKKFLELFNHNTIHLSIIHTILMLLAPHKENEEIKNILNELKNLFDTRIKKLNRKPKIAVEN